MISSGKLNLKFLFRGDYEKRYVLAFEISNFCVNKEFYRIRKLENVIKGPS